MGRMGCGWKMGRCVDECRVAAGAKAGGMASAREEDDECWYNAVVGANKVVVEFVLSWVYEKLCWGYEDDVGDEE